MTHLGDGTVGARCRLQEHRVAVAGAVGSQLSVRDQRVLSIHNTVPRFFLSVALSAVTSSKVLSLLSAGGSLNVWRQAVSSRGELHVQNCQQERAVVNWRVCASSKVGYGQCTPVIPVFRRLRGKGVKNSRPETCV